MSDKSAAEFIKQARSHGFTDEQASFLFNHLAGKPHTHLSSDIIVDPEDGQTLDDFVEACEDAIADLSADGEGEEATAAVVVDEDDGNETD